MKTPGNETYDDDDDDGGGGGSGGGNGNINDKTIKADGRKRREVESSPRTRKKILLTEIPCLNSIS